MDTKAKIEVMQAYLRGETIEARAVDIEGSVWSPWVRLGEPNWNWEKCDYRVKKVLPSIDWDHVSGEYNYLAVDEDGGSFLYGVKPKKQEGFWNPNGEYCSTKYFASFEPGNINWEDSLISRPGVK